MELDSGFSQIKTWALFNGKFQTFTTNFLDSNFWISNGVIKQNYPILFRIGLPSNGGPDKKHLDKMDSPH